MKVIFAAMGLFAAAVTTFGLGVLNADLSGTSEVPPNSSSSVGTASLTLSGNAVSYTVSAILFSTLPVDAGLFGPAVAGQVAAMVFDLGTPSVSAVGGNNFVTYSGTVALTTQQVSDLKANLDYISVATTGYPGGEIRGQVTLLPEPSSAVLLGLGAGLAWLYRRKQA